MDHEWNVSRLPGVFDVRRKLTIELGSLTSELEMAPYKDISNSSNRSFTVGCKTEDGFTVILVERGEGVSTKPIKTSYSSSAGTAYITFDNVQVPVENTLGEEGGGIFVMLSNFNHERWVMCCTTARGQRLVVEECLK